jgi:predicted Rdx family selenoprotein
MVSTEVVVAVTVVLLSSVRVRKEVLNTVPRDVSVVVCVTGTGEVSVIVLSTVVVFPMKDEPTT